MPQAIHHNDGEWGTTFGPEEINDDLFGSVLVTLPKPMRCPNCGGEGIGTRFRLMAAAGTIGADGERWYPLQPPERKPDAYECGDCGFETATAEPFEEAGRAHLKAQEPETPRSPRLRRLRETIALWLAPWITEWDEEGW